MERSKDIIMNWLDWLFQQAVLNIYLPNKEKRSRDLAQQFSKFNVSLPQLGLAGQDKRIGMDTINKINEYCGRLPYKSDPLWGFVDLYNHPEFTNYFIVNNIKLDTYDCDDVAVLAKALCDRCGCDSSKSWIWNLIIRPDKQFTEAAYNHVICGIEFWDGIRNWTVVIDTNTVARREVFFFLGKKEEVKQQVISKFNSIYNVTYSILLDVRYPFY